MMKFQTYLIAAITVAVLAFSVLAVLVLNGVTTSFDEATLLWINQHASPGFDSFFVAFTELGGLIVVTVVSALLFGYFLYRKKYTKALLVAAGVGGAALMNIILKSIFDRPRPDLWEWLVVEAHFSFPSGHATASMALAIVVVALLWKTKWRIVSMIGAAMYILSIGFSRLYLGVHYPTDILGGWLLGAAWVLLVIGVIFASRQRKTVKGIS